MNLIDGLTLDPGFLLAIVAAGIFGGLVSGLLGVGGGIVLVPVLYHILSVLDVDVSIRMQIAVATSLTTIVFTSFSSLRSHRKRNAIDADLLKAWVVPVFVGVVCGSLLGGTVDGRVLSGVFAVMALIIGARMLFARVPEGDGSGFRSRIAKFVSGLSVGFVSALMGIGGGTLSVPILTTVGYDIRRAVGTASAIGFVIAIPGAATYIATGWGTAGLPPYSVGYVNWLAVAAIVPLTISMAPVGAWMAHSIPRRALQACFGVFLLATALSMGWDTIWAARL